MKPERHNLLLAMIATALALASFACGTNEGFPPPPSGGNNGQGGNGSSGPTSGAGGYSVGPCSEEGATRSCEVYLGTHGEVTTCVVGTQACVGGEWSPCEQASLKHRTLRKDAFPELGLGRDIRFRDVYDDLGQPLPHVLNVTATTCGSPCSPTCQQFNETPSGAIANPIPGGPYNAGSLSSVPNGLKNKGIVQPCEYAGDCQFGYYCSDPVSDSKCNHDKCATGAQLSAGTNSCASGDSCVNLVCAKDPSCCSYAGTCAHDPCVTGVGLSGCKAADPCVNTVCTQKASCCTGTWDNSCVSLAQSKCGLSCSGKWDASCVQKLHDVCGAFCNNATPSCAHDKCYTGDPLTGSCDPCVNTICTNTPSCCSTAWDATCVAKVATLCSASVQCPSPRGLCSSWSPNQVDSSCNGVDLYAGVPCGNSIPVCNGGKQDKPAGTPIRIVGFSANSSQLPKLPPTCGGGGCLKKECSTTAAIPSGQCVDLPCSLPNNAETYINPPAPPTTPGSLNIAQYPECSYDNNWTINGGSGSCGGANCTPTGGVIEAKTADIVIVMDRSAAVAAGVWSGIKSAVQTFVADTASQGTAPAMKVALTVFPDDKPPGTLGDQCRTTGGQACQASACNNPFLNYTSLQTGATTVSTAMGTVNQSTRDAPTSAALGGGYLIASSDYTSAPATSKPAPIVIFIMASDAAYCNTSVTSMAGQASAANAANGTRTFVIGLGLSSSLTAQTIAFAGGGKGYNYTNTNAATNVLAALRDIRDNQVVPCSVDLPDTAIWDPSNPTVQYQAPGSLTKTTLTQRTNLTNCGTNTGFYYDNNATPTQIRLCPASCTNAKQLGAITTVSLNCTGTYGNSTVPLSVYQASCPAGTVTQWDYLGYSAITPVGTSVDFAAQTGKTAGTLGALVPLATAALIPTDTQNCPLGALPAPNGATCPIDVFKALNGNNPYGPAQYPFLNLQITLNAKLLATPKVTNFQLTYSCPDAQ
jgi:hypothetical protein